MPAEPDVRIALRQVDDIGRARAVLRRLIGLPADDRLVVDTLLSASELVSNALEHATGVCAMSVWYSATTPTIRVEVSDTYPEAQLTAAMPEPDRMHGRGLAIVATVSSRWGTERTPTGKIVWFEIDR